MVVVTPTYGPDLALFTDLHESFLNCFAEDVKHLVVTPAVDRHLFRQFEGPRCDVHTVGDVLPRRMIPVPGANMWLNWRRPIPPVRGWIMQQLVKLAVAEQAEEHIVVLADSDVSFIRPVTYATFAPAGVVRFYRKAGGVTDAHPLHRRWHAEACQLLGLPEPHSGPLPDYILPLVSWDRDLVRAMLGRIGSERPGSWIDRTASKLRFSEFTLYGVYCDSLGDASVVGENADDGLCACYWETEPLTEIRAEEFSSTVRATDVAVMISAKSNTPLHVRQGIVQRFSLR